MTAPQVLAAALAALPNNTPLRLRALVEARPTLAEVWSDLVDGRAPAIPGVDTALRSAWTSSARAVDLDALSERMTRLGVGVRVLGHDGYPERLASDPSPPAVLFERAGVDGNALDAILQRPTVAIVGTRQCTAYGRDVAAHLGRELSVAGISIVSGLAIGIDGAAHEGALAAGAAPPLAVVGSGPDVVYPRRHRRLWDRVVEAGSVVGEAPLGAPPMPHRFPLRNRIIAGLSDLVIVVESHAAGGSMHTVQSAIDRGVPVMAVPGSVRSPSSAGTNRLLADGVAPVLDVDDVLVALSLESPGRFAAASSRSQSRAEVEGPDAAVLAAVDWSPTRTEVVLQRTGLDLGPAAAALTRLEMAGLVRSSGGGWERR
jgi:DNA processing protein